MNKSEFAQLQVGDKVTHADLLPDVLTIASIEIDYDYDSELRPFPIFTWAINTGDGSRMKIGDHYVNKLMKVLYDAPILDDVMIGTYSPTIFISGSRDATPRNLDMARKAVMRAKQIGGSVICGDADGVDAEVIKTCDESGISVQVYGAHGKLRNRTKGAYNHPLKVSYHERDCFCTHMADMVICLWNGRSEGTKANYDRGLKMNKPSYLIK